MEAVDPQGLVQTGAVGVLAVLVYFELRALRPMIRALELAVSALLERDRMRARDSGPVPSPPSLRRLGRMGDDE